MLIVRREKQIVSGLAAVKVMVNKQKIATLSIGAEHQFVLQPGIHEVYFERLLIKSNKLILDVKSIEDTFIIECKFNAMASALNATIVSIQRETLMSEQIASTQPVESIKRKVIVCDSCGAKTTVIPGRVSECEYCGTSLP